MNHRPTVAATARRAPLLLISAFEAFLKRREAPFEFVRTRDRVCELRLCERALSKKAGAVAAASQLNSPPPLPSSRPSFLSLPLSVSWLAEEDSESASWGGG